MAGWALIARKSCAKSERLEWAIVLVSVPLVIPIAASYGVLFSSVLPAVVVVSMLGFFLFDARKMLVAVLFNLLLAALVGALVYLEIISVSFIYTQVTIEPGALCWWISQVCISLYPLATGILMTMFLLRGLDARECQIRNLSRKDGLTNIWNRRYLMEIFEREILASQRNGYPLSFIMIDLDYFKKINDTYGHKMGDRAIIIAAEALQKALRASDYLGRYGGEEFAAVLPNCNANSAWEVAERCRQTVENMAVEFSGYCAKLTVSVGVTTLNDLSKASADDIIDRADQALYRAKTSGRNRVSFYPEMSRINLASA
jgi:diguanylate cyclase (GGDEF)-like protein